MIYILILPEFSQNLLPPGASSNRRPETNLFQTILVFLVIAFFKQEKECITLEKTKRKIRESFTQNHHPMKAWLLVISF